MAGPTAPTTAPTAIRAGGPLLSPVRRNIIFTALVFGVLVAATGQTIVVPALPTIVAELGSTVDQSWAVTSYLLGGDPVTGPESMHAGVPKTGKRRCDSSRAGLAARTAGTWR